MKLNHKLFSFLIIGFSVFILICDKTTSNSDTGPVPNIASISEPIVSATKIKFYYDSPYGGHPIDSFIVYWSLTPDQGTSGNPIYGLYDRDQGYIHSGLTPKTKYYYTVVAYNKYGASQPSDDTCIITDSLFIPDDLIGGPSSETTIVINWNTPYSMYYLDTVSHKVYWSTQSGLGINAEYSQVTTLQNYEPTGMQTFTKYYFVVTTIIGTYESSPSQESCIRSGGKIVDLTIPDDSLKAAILNHYQTMVHECDSLYCRNKGIKNLTGLEWFPHMRILYIDSNEISDLTPLQDLHMLKKLHARTNQISNINVLLSLKELSYVDLTGNSINIPCDDLQQLKDSLGLGNVFPSLAVDGVNCTD